MKRLESADTLIQYTELPRFSLHETDENGRKIFCSFDIDEYIADRDNPPKIWIARIFVPHRHQGKGYGSKMLRAFCEWCDANQRTALLDINPYGRLDEDALIAWYFRHGFRMQGNGSMIRRPKQS
jgi:GNAT superfamily N-acetyltransferase